MEKDKVLLVKYYRLSLEDQNAGESNSIGNQRKLIEDYVKRESCLRNMPSLELADDGYTGTNFRRPGIRKFFELLKGNKVACLIVKDFSRFTRDYIELGNYAEQVFPFMGVRFISVNDGYDSEIQSSIACLEIPFKGILNDLYSKDNSIKVKTAKRQMIKDGRLCSGSYPFGYQKVKRGEDGWKETPYRIDEEAAEAVRIIFQMALEGRKNIEIARILNEKGYLTPGMAKRKNGDFGYGLKDGEISIWDSVKVLRILRDERYTGTLITGRYQSMGTGSGKVKEKPEEMWVRRENRIPVIISKEDFELVQKMKPIYKRGKYRKDHHRLYRKIRCGCCGRFLYIKPSDSKEQDNLFFCKQTHLRSDSGCFCGYIRERDILELILKIINMQIKLSEKIKTGFVKRSEQKIHADDKQMTELYLNQLEKAQNYRLYRMGKLSKEEFLKKKDNLQREINQDEQKTERNHEMMEKMENGCEIQKLSREMIETLIETIWVYDGERVKIRLNYRV